ncbi:MAG: hypothetical protein AMXMBFR13_23030 [Phycisphaerae bacterium]
MEPVARNGGNREWNQGTDLSGGLDDFELPDSPEIRLVEGGNPPDTVAGHCGYEL